MSSGPGLLIKPSVRPVLVLFLLLLLWGCTPKSLVRLEEFTSVTEKGEFLSAISGIKGKPSLYDNNSRFLYHMDIGLLYHYAGVLDSSLKYLLKASDLYDELFTRSVSGEAASILVNDLLRPYRGKPYEVVLVHQVCELNYLALGKPDEALVEARRAQLRFNEWERTNAEDNRYFTDPMFHYITSIAYDQQGNVDDAMISLYHAIGGFKRGPVKLPDEIRHHAYSMLQRNGRESDIQALGLTPAVPAAIGPPPPSNQQSEIVVIGYAGKGPSLSEEQWWGNWIKGGLLVLQHTGPEGKTETITLPAPPLPDQGAKGGRDKKAPAAATVFVKIALPRIKTYPSLTSYFTVRSDSDIPSATTTVINDYDAQAEKQLKDAKTSIIARTVVRTVIRTLTAQEVKNQMASGNPIANLLFSLTTDLLSSQLEKADTRLCFFTPKTVQIARIPVPPGTYSITVAAHDRSGKVLNRKTFSNIIVQPRKKQFVIYHSFG